MRGRIFCSVAVTAVACISVWAANWPSVAGNPQRDGWARQETHLSPANAKNIKLIYRHHFDNKAIGLNALTSSIDIATVVGYTGFHEFLWTGSSSNTIYQNDADMNYEFKRAVMTPREKAPVPASSSVLCPAGMTAAPIMRGGSNPSRFGGSWTDLGLFWALNTDGYLNTLRQQDSNNTWIAPQKFLPAGSNVAALNMGQDYRIFAATLNDCNGKGNGLYAIQFHMPKLAGEPNKPFAVPPSWEAPVSFMTNGAGFAGAGGTALNSASDTVFGTVPSGKGDMAGEYSDTTLALDAKTLAPKDYFTPTERQPGMKAGILSAGVTPMVFTEGDKEYVVTGDRNGRIYLLDSTALGGSDHHTPLTATDPLVSPDTAGSGEGVWGTFATQVDTANGNTRYIYAAVHGPVKIKFPGTNGAAAHGGVVAFKLDLSGGHPKLIPAWSSHDILSPAGPITAGGLVFALSSGMSTRTATSSGKPYAAAQIVKMAKPATLFVLDAATGAELYTSGPLSAFSNQPLSFANGHVYISTHDNSLYQFGIPEER